MVHEILWQDPSVQRAITRTDSPSEQTSALLRDTVWGSRATRYKILDIDEKLRRLRDPSFIVLTEAGQELSVVVLDYCHKQVAGRSCGVYHFVMASTLPERQNTGLAGFLLDQARKFCVETVGAPGLGFAYVEATTEFSLKLSDRIGHTIEADIPLILFTRLVPRPDPRVGSLKPEEATRVVNQLNELYADHELLDFETSLRPAEYVVYRSGADIVAGAQVEKLHWSVVSIPGPQGRFLLNMLPHLPGLNRILDLKDLTILRFGNLLVSDGAEPQFFSLLETCLARTGSRIGLILLDGNSAVPNRLRSSGRFGLISRALSGSVKLHIDVVGMDAATRDRLATAPLLVSAADVF